VSSSTSTQSFVIVLNILLHDLLSVINLSLPGLL
jgi:hypothetical protein